LEQRVLLFMQEQHLMSGQPRLVVGVSGGTDSVCLLHILVKLRKELGITINVAHLNHQLRGAEADADAQYVAELARQLDVPIIIDSRNVKAYQTGQRISMEEAAREVRYDFLAEVAESVGTDRVAVGHTVDDNVETILMHLIRGTGTRGLRGLQPLSPWQSFGGGLTVIRPLLPVSRQETVDYCHQNRLIPRIDTSNQSLSPLRNRIRHQLLPLLRSYNPRVDESLLRTARIAADDLAFIDGEITRLQGEITQKMENTVILDKEKFGKLPSALKRQLLRISIEDLLGNLKDIETRHIEGIMGVLDKPAGRRISLPGGLIFSIEYDKYLLGTDTAALSPFPVLEGEFTLKIPGETEAAGWHVKATIIDREQTAEKDDDFTAHFDLDKAGGEMTVRRRRPGDRFQLLGMSQPKKLNQFMIDAKIPRAWRSRIPLVCSPRHILWVVGWRIDERVKVTDTTRQILSLKFKRR